MTHFDVLGIPPDATDDAVAAAYLRLARVFHPDAHPHASDEERAVYQAKMTELNVAYAALKNARRRSEYLRSARPDGTASARDAAPGGCALCGATPASPVEFDRGRKTRWTALLCRECARSVLAPTPTQPTYSLARHRRRLRLITWVVLAGALFGLASIGLRSLRESMRANYEPLQQSVGPLTSALTTSNPWLANDCVSTPTGADSLMIPVDCAQPHDGRIVARVTRADDCPPTTDEPRYEPTINSVLCVETTR